MESKSKQDESHTTALQQLEQELKSVEDQKKRIERRIARLKRGSNLTTTFTSSESAQDRPRKKTRVSCSAAAVEEAKSGDQGQQEEVWYQVGAVVGVKADSCIFALVDSDGVTPSKKINVKNGRVEKRTATHLFLSTPKLRFRVARQYCFPFLAKEQGRTYAAPFDAEHYNSK